MKRIKATFQKNDRIVCMNVPGKHRLFYQPVGTNEQIWLLDTKEFSGSVFEYFRSKGKKMSNNCFSITINELYEFKKFKNYKLASLFDYLPKQIEYVIRERNGRENKYKTEKRKKTKSRDSVCDTYSYYDNEYVA